MSSHVTHPVPLNVFQRLVRAWDRVHPYNAAQAMRVAGAPDAGAVGRAWAEALTATGLGSVRVGGDGVRYEVLNGELANYPVAVLPAADALAGHLSAELNRPFDDPGEPPFRPFLAPAGGDVYLGLVYQHWVADSVAVRLLLREWLFRLFDPGRARARPVRHAAGGYGHLFGPRPGAWYTPQTLLSLFRRHMRYRRARKVNTFGQQDYPVAVLLRAARAGLIDRVRDYAHRTGVKVNDVFLAAAAEACDKFVPFRQRSNRRDVAVGSIVDLRPHARGRLGDTFGLFLGFTEVFCRPAELRDFSRLVRAVADQGRLHRGQGIAPTSLGWMTVAAAAGRFVPAENVYHFYRKEVPLLGGVSNVNLNETWPADYPPGRVCEFLRVSPTGPLTPLVFALTTLGHGLHLSLTYRPALMDEKAAGEMAEMFLARLDRLCG